MMDYNHFRKLLDVRKPTERADLALLQEFVRDYPFCQTGQLLLAGAMHEQDHVGYDGQLRRTAAYAPDRTALFNLIHGIETAAHSSAFAVGANSPFQVEDQTVITPVNAPVEDAVGNIFTGIISDDVPAILDANSENPAADTSHLREYVPSESRPVDPEPTESDDPHDTIRRRLEQLLVKPAPEEVPAGNSETDSEQDPPPAAQPISTEDSHPAIENTASVFEYVPVIEENLIHEIEKLPIINREESMAPPAAQPADFFGWLSTKPVSGFGTFEMVDGDDTSIVDVSENTHPRVQDAAEVPPASGQGKDLIEKFIQAEPRIVPQPKAEFFNPSVQAKRSVEEHDDLVSETLARIYADQGNLMKARKAYEQLRLLHPEKNAYFAALVLKIDNQLNSTTSEDL